MFEIPLQLVDDILLDLHLGHALLGLFVAAAAGAFLVNRSVKVLGINFAVFGLIFIVTPSGTMPTMYLYFGILLAVVGPVIAVAAET